MVDILPPGHFYDPSFWDYNILMPIWAWLIVGLFLLGMFILICMFYVWLVMRPVSNFGKVADTGSAIETGATKGSATQVFSIWKNRSFVIEAMWYYGNILSYSNPLEKMQMWLHTSEKATGHSAKKPVMITRDGFDGTADFIAEMAVCQIPKIFNRDWGMEVVQKKDPSGKLLYKQATDNQGNLQYDLQGHEILVPDTELVERKDREGKPYALTTFSNIRSRRALLEKMYPDGVPIEIYKPYDLAEIYRFTPQNHDSLKFGLDIVEEAKEWLENEQSDKPQSGFLDKHGVFIMVGLFGLITTIIIFAAFPVK